MMPVDRKYDRNAVNCGRRFGDRCDAAYDLLGRLEPGLCVDVGAAIGRTTRRMLERSASSRVVAYEPFAGNHRYLRDAVGDDRRVTLRLAAVADRVGREPFLVPKVVQPGETGWAKTLPGYSSLGYLAGGDAGEEKLVDVVTLDNEIHEHVRFLKIDVQGGELRVLKGAVCLMRQSGVDMMHVEFNGSLDVLHLLRANGYIIFDGPYMAWPARRYFRNWLRRRPDWSMPHWPIIEQGMMSMGWKAAHMWPTVPLRGFGPYCAWFFTNRLLRCGLQTDLLCIRESFLPTVWRAMDEGAA